MVTETTTYVCGNSRYRIYVTLWKFELYKKLRTSLFPNSIITLITERKNYIFATRKFGVS